MFKCSKFNDLRTTLNFEPGTLEQSEPEIRLAYAVVAEDLAARTGHDDAAVFQNIGAV
jgi:hypothetical protein